jgi:hypothetical protein
LGDVATEHLQELRTGHFEGIKLFSPPSPAAATKNRLLGYQRDVVGKMLEKCDVRLEDYPIINHT